MVNPAVLTVLMLATLVGVVIYTVGRNRLPRFQPGDRVKIKGGEERGTFLHYDRGSLAWVRLDGMLEEFGPDILDVRELEHE